MTPEDTKKEREERAARLHQQIEDLKKGKFPRSDEIHNPRDFISEKMQELAEKDEQEDHESDGTADLPDN